MASQHNLLTPVQVQDREEKTMKLGEGSTKMYFNFEGFTFLYIDHYKQVFLPVFRIDIRSRDIQVDSKASSEFYTGLRLEASYNNSRTASWEPLIEPCYFDIIYRAKKNENIICVIAGSEDNQEALFFNVSEELVEVLAHCTQNIHNLLEDNQPTGQSLTTTPKSTTGAIQEESVSESQFLVRNLSGYDINVQTIGTKKSKPLLIPTQQEKFVNFIQDDEFAIKATLIRSLYVTFASENIKQSRQY